MLVEDGFHCDFLNLLIDLLYVMLQLLLGWQLLEGGDATPGLEQVEDHVINVTIMLLHLLDLLQSMIYLLKPELLD